MAGATLERRRRTQDERSADTRRKLIEAAIELICERGYANTTTPEIALRAGVSRGALQHQFHTRYDLIAAVSDRVTRDMLTLGEDLPAGSRALRSRIDAVIDHYWSVYTSPAFLAVLNIYLGTQKDAEMRRRIRRHFSNIDQASDEPWLELFSDTGIAPAQLATLRRLALATLRGLAVARLLGILRGAAQSEIDLLKSMLDSELNAL